MRTTLDINVDVLAAADDLAKKEGKPGQNPATCTASARSRREAWW